MANLLVGFLLMLSAMACMAIGLATHGRPLRRGCSRATPGGNECGGCDGPPAERS